MKQQGKENTSWLRRVHIREDADDEAASETAYHRRYRHFGKRKGRTQRRKGVRK